MRIFFASFVLLAMLSAATYVSSAATIEFGNDKSFQRIGEIVAQAKPDDEIVVHPKNDGSPT